MKVTYNRIGKWLEGRYVRIKSLSSGRSWYTKIRSVRNSIDAKDIVFEDGDSIRVYDSNEKGFEIQTLG